MPLNASVPADVKAEVEKLEGEMRAGTFHPFTGPVVDQDGKIRVPAGEVISDKDLGQMKYFVEGVASKLRQN
ncbi:Purine-binding protein precursor [compost metagenome]